MPYEFPCYDSLEKRRSEPSDFPTARVVAPSDAVLLDVIAFSAVLQADSARFTRLVEEFADV